MPNEIEITIREDQLAQFEEKKEEALEAAMQGALNVVQAKVRDLTPRWKGGLVAGVLVENHVHEGRVFMEGVVAKVHEFNGTWSRMPPIEPLKEWVQGKLGVSEPDSRSVAFAVAKKILAMGLTLPNKEGRGRMMARTFELMQKTGFHMTAWNAALNRLRSMV